MSRRGAVILSTVSLLLRRAPASRFRHGGLRLTPPVTTSFALMHRNFSSSSQSDDEGKKQEKHKKGTSPSSLSEVSQGGGSSQKKQQQQQQQPQQPETEVKVVWEYPNDSKVPKKSYQHMEIAHRLGDEVAIRVAKFRTNQKHKQMLAKYEAHRKQMELELEREKQRIEMKMKAEQKLNPNVATPPAKGAANATQKPEESVKVEKQQKSETRKSVAKPGVKRKSSWSLFNWMKRSDDKIKKNETSGDDEDLKRLNLSDLRARLRARGLSATGRKQTLIERLETTTTTTAATPVTTTTTTTSSNLSPTCPGEETTQQQQQLVNCVASDAEAATDTGNESTNDDVLLEYVNGMPQLTIRLPSRNELCQFALKPISHTVGHLLAMLREEDRGIDRAAIINKHGVRIASSCTIERLLDDEFSIQINNRTLGVQPPEREKITMETVDKMSDVRKIIGQLYEAFNVGEYQLEKSNQLAKELESLRYELEPLEEKKMELAKRAERRTNMMTWMGLGLMSVQFGILARLTWWEYSWDIMEPVTYFVTYGTTMAMYAYYCVTKREYIMENVYNREYTLSIYRNAKKQQFDVENYNRLKRRTAELEYNLRRLNDPINMELPAHLVRTQLDTPPTDESNSSSVKSQVKST